MPLSAYFTTHYNLFIISEFHPSQSGKGYRMAAEWLGDGFSRGASIGDHSCD